MNFTTRMHKRAIFSLGDIRWLASKMKSGPVYCKVGTGLLLARFQVITAVLIKMRFCLHRQRRHWFYLYQWTNCPTYTDYFTATINNSIRNNYDDDYYYDDDDNNNDGPHFI